MAFVGIIFQCCIFFSLLDKSERRKKFVYIKELVREIVLCIVER